jgi:ABC-2 type transport system ATP-binding protein
MTKKDDHVSDATIEVIRPAQAVRPDPGPRRHDLHRAPGRVTGFVGPNGAGKSTTIRVILGLDSVDEGTALVGGQPYATCTHPLRHVGSLVDAGALQPSRTGRNHLLWMARSQDWPSAGSTR